MGSPAYSALLLVAIVVSGAVWWRMSRADPRLPVLYLAALGGAFVGAKLLYLAAEGWIHWGHPDQWLQWAAGKTILGGLSGGFVAVEIAKRFVGYEKPTGDAFAALVPWSLIIGRIGCLIHGCCLGRVCGQPHWFTLADSAGTPRWPAVPVEIAFNALCLVAFAVLRRTGQLTGQHFHLYLIAYGLFRFAHEFVRDTPRVAGPLSGYALAALVLTATGAAAFIRRARPRSPALP